MSYDQWKCTEPEPSYYDWDDREPAEPYWHCAHCGCMAYKGEFSVKVSPGKVICFPCEEAYPELIASLPSYP